MRLIAEEVYRHLFGGKVPNCGLTSGFSALTVPLGMVRQEFASYWLRNQLQKFFIHFTRLT
jgi:hypothetical protein